MQDWHGGHSSKAVGWARDTWRCTPHRSLDRLPEVGRSRGGGATGKTTTVAAPAKSLNAEGRYTALLASCEEAQAAGEDINRGIAAILNQIGKKAAGLPEPQRPPPAESVADVDGVSRLGNYLTLWAERSPRPVVLFLDEIDSMMVNTLISVLRQLRAGYPDRPARFPQSVALVGMRDVRDYKIAKGEVLHTASPFNIKDRSFLLANLPAEEVATLYEQHTAGGPSSLGTDAGVFGSDPGVS